MEIVRDGMGGTSSGVRLGWAPHPRGSGAARCGPDASMCNYCGDPINSGAIEWVVAPSPLGQALEAPICPGPRPAGAVNRAWTETFLPVQPASSPISHVDGGTIASADSRQSANRLKTPCKPRPSPSSLSSSPSRRALWCPARRLLRQDTTPPRPRRPRRPLPPLPPLAAQTTLAGSPPALPAKAWLLMDFDSGEVLASANADEPLPPASLTKMMTSYLVEQALRSGKLNQTDLVSVSQNAWCRGSSSESCMYLPLNSQATVIDILRGIIIQSGNDASKAIAEHMAGSEEGFAKLMNAEAQRLGMTHSHFMNPTGLPDPDHKSSARDLAILARAIIRDSADYYPIYAEREFKYHGIKQGNRNA